MRHRARGRAASERVARAVRAGARAPAVALRRTAGQPQVLRMQLAWSAVIVAFWAATVSLSVVAFAEGGSGGVALAVVARTLPGAVLGPTVGTLVDRFPRRRCLLWTTMTGGAASAASAAARSLGAVIALVSVVAVVTVLFRLQQSAVLPELVEEPADLTAANVVSSAVEALGVFAGPALAGLLLAVQGPEVAFAAAALLFALATVLLLGLRQEDTVTGTGTPLGPGRLRDLARLPAARLVLLLVLAQTVVSGGLVVLYPALAVHALHARLSAVALLTAAFGLGGVLGSVGAFSVAGSPRLGRCCTVGLLLWSVPLLALTATRGLAAVLLLLAVVGAGNVLLDVSGNTLLQRAVPLRLRGRAFGAVESVAVLGLGLGAALAPALDSWLGPGHAVAVLAAPLLAVAALTLRALDRLDGRVHAPARQVALLRPLAPFALLPTLELERLALRLRPVRLPAGAVVVRQGEPGATWFLIDSGTLRVDVDGRPVRELTRGDSFGEVALLRGGIRSATVTARTPVALWSLDADVFLAALRVDDGRALAAVDALAQERLDHAAPGFPVPHA